MIAVTHELKTPIAIAKLNLETLQKRKLDEQQQHKLLANTLQEANRMNALCNNMLLSSQFDTGGYRITKGRDQYRRTGRSMCRRIPIQVPVETDRHRH